MDDTKWLIARELPRLRRFARSLRHDAAGADDLVQDCLERALRKHELWRRGSNMRAWLFRILYNLHLSSLRSAKRSPLSSPAGEEDGLADGVSRGNQIATIQLGELSHALGDLPSEQRDVITLVALEGMRYDEAAAVLGISMGTVRSRLSRGRASLRETVLGDRDASCVEVEQAEGPRLRRVQ